MARASSPTHLSLDRWAQMIGLNPVHFAGAAGANIWPQTGGACRDIWSQHSWQSPDLISREELGRQIRLAEMSVAHALGYLAAPGWIAAEEHDFPRYHNIGWQPIFSSPRSISTNYRHVIAGGRRATDLVDDSVTVTYTDEDSDSFFETATITISGVTVSDVREIKVFFAGKSGKAEWEIRPLRSTTLASGVYTAVFDSWLAIDPSLWEYHPVTYEREPIDVTTASNFVTTVDVYRVYNSTLAAPSVFYSSNGFYCQYCSNIGCANCTQDGCLLVDNGEFGRVQSSPGFYDEDSAAWVSAACPPAIDARTVKLWYYSGLQSQQYLAGETHDPLDDLLAEAILLLATARLSKPVCSCSNVRLMADDLRRDFAFGDRNNFNLIWRSSVVQTNPFGTKAGEVRAWKIVDELIGDAVIGGVM